MLSFCISLSFWFFIITRAAEITGLLCQSFYFLMIKLSFPFRLVWETKLLSAEPCELLSSSRRIQSSPGSMHSDAWLCNGKFLLLQDLSILILQLSQRCHVLFASYLSYKIKSHFLFQGDKIEKKIKIKTSISPCLLYFLPRWHKLLQYVIHRNWKKGSTIVDEQVTESAAWTEFPQILLLTIIILTRWLWVPRR